MLLVCRAAARKGLKPQAETGQRAPAVCGASVAREACPRARRSALRRAVGKVAYLQVPLSVSDTEYISCPARLPDVRRPRASCRSARHPTAKSGEMSSAAAQRRLDGCRRQTAVRRRGVAAGAGSCCMLLHAIK